jgi:ABC-2 type transport system permease protein
MIDRIFNVAKKEFIQLRRDPKFLRMILMPPLVQLIVFGYVATLDVKKIPLAVCDQCRSLESREIVEKFTANDYYVLKGYISSVSQCDDLLDRDVVDAVLVIPPDFARDLKRGRTAHIQMLVNGVNSNKASIASNYASTIILSYSQKILLDKIGRMGASGYSELVSSRDRVWFNPELKSVNYMVPGIIAMILMIMLVPMTSMNIVKEKETGTIEQLNITPLTPLELIIGKIIPFVIIGFVDIALVTFLGLILFGIVMKGSLLLLYFLSVFFIVGALMLGIFISTISDNMTQAFMGSFFFIFPNMLLSGFIFPISSMPEVLQWLTYLIPMRYFLVIIRSIFLKGSGFFELLPETAGLIFFSMVVLVLSAVFIVQKSRKI